jgi:hypothetical protein
MWGQCLNLHQGILGSKECEKRKAKEAADGMTSIGFRARQIILSAWNLELYDYFKG